MSAEAQATLERMAQVRNVADRGEIQKPAVRLLRKRERQERQDELKRIDQQLSAPAWAASAMSAEGRQSLAKRRRQLEKELQNWSPRTDLSPETRDALHRRSKELEEEIRQGMPTAEVMRRNPVGAVDAHRKWDRRKDKVLEWKNLQVQLEPESDDIDLANVERLRPTQVAPGSPASFMADAQIPGNFAMTAKAKERWPLGEPTAKTAVSHLSEQEAVAEVTTNPKRPPRPFRAQTGKGVPATLEGQVAQRKKISTTKQKKEARRMAMMEKRLLKRLEKVKAEREAMKAGSAAPSGQE